MFGFAGHAATRIQKALRRELRVTEPDSLLVSKQNVLLDGELDRARAWGSQLARETVRGAQEPLPRP